MLPEHYIEWVSLQTKQGNQRKELHPGENLEVCFALCEGDEVEAVYAYCKQSVESVIHLKNPVPKSTGFFINVTLQLVKRLCPAVSDKATIEERAGEREKSISIRIRRLLSAPSEKDSRYMLWYPPRRRSVHRVQSQMYVPGVQESNCRSGPRGGLPLYVVLQTL